MKNTAPQNNFAGKKRWPLMARNAVCLIGLVALTACATGPDQSTPAAQAAPANVPLNDLLARGDAAAAQDDHVNARIAWRSAAKDYPAEKQPWLKLAEDYFNAGDYGNAVLAAKEALQRDPHNRMANSVLAVSGLRLTAGSLASLRGGEGYAVGSRDEAVSLTHQLREALGEPVLVPPSNEPSMRKRLVKPRPRSPVSGDTTRMGAARDAGPAEPEGAGQVEMK